VGGDDAHFSAIIFTNGSVMQVKAPYQRKQKRKMFESPVAWADSLPEFVDNRKECIRTVQIAGKMFQFRV
jgi:hypothetical protein